LTERTQFFSVPIGALQGFSLGLAEFDTENLLQREPVSDSIDLKEWGQTVTTSLV
jgi:hypothetical protein